MHEISTTRFIALLLTLCLGACSDSSDRSAPEADPPAEPPPATIPPDENSVYAAAHRCVTVASAGGERLVSGETGFEWREVGADGAARFRLQPADLGVYLLYDDNRDYLVAENGRLLGQVALQSDTRLVDGEIIIEDRRQSEGEWALIAADNGRFQLQHLRTGQFLGPEGLVADSAEAAQLDFEEAGGCADFPELTLDASGQISKTRFDDGDVFGFVETHSHLFTNLAFGGGGVFHGAPFHRLGVEHALNDCELSHGPGGRRDLMGSAFSSDAEISDVLLALAAGELPEDDHRTEGYPEFTDWPDAPRSATHQVQYYRWLERAYLGGLRLLVQHVTTNEVLCELATGVGAQPQRIACPDMVAADRIIEETYALERYIDARSGGPGQGWFRIVFNPQEARQQIEAGKLAVVLGLEVPDLFNCYLVPPEGREPCTREDVVEQLDTYYDRGVRVLFPVHKYDNAFSAGDGDRGIIEIGNLAHTGHYGNLAPCPEEFLGFRGGFDEGGTPFPDLQQPRDVYDSPPPFDVSGFPQDPIGTLLAFVGLFSGPDTGGEYCQNHGLTDLGEFLIGEVMKRGMILEVDHFPRRSYVRAYEILEANDYPAIGSHGRNNNGRLYGLGGMSKINFGRCRDPQNPGALDDSLQDRLALMRERGDYPAEGFGFDLNGFAGAPGARFGERSNCAAEQTDDGVTYPFTSFAGDITFERPRIGNRILDFNTEGMVHLGLVAELIEDVRRDATSDEELEPLFRSAEKYLRLWEKTEAFRASGMSPL